ncbi:MAG: sugar phosphate isomerase/epimerase [Lentisphaerae bacterium]|nr:sugar phosphate isomerase/epimerase [Lentisphaerota bacterium]
MFHVPVTYFFEFRKTNEQTRSYIMGEFAANGAKYLVLTHDLINMIMADFTAAAKLEKEMSAAGLTFLDAHAPFGQYLDLNNPEPAVRRQLILRHKLHIQIAADMGVDTVTIHPGNDYYYPEVPLPQQISNTIAALDEILPVAADRGVTVCIENIWCRSNTPEKLLEIKAAFPCDTLGFCFDAGHANQMDKGRNFEKNSAADCYVLVGETPVYDDQIGEKMLPHIVNCHLNDNDGQYDTHINIFDGNTDWTKVMRLLRKAPRLKCIQSEVIPVANKTSIRDICEAFRKLGEIY